MFKKRFNLFVVLIISFGIGCSSTKVVRVDVDEKIDLSGRWNDYDAMLVSKEMVEDCLDNQWLAKFLQEKNRSPIVLVGHIYNRTDEHLNAQVFIKYLERELLNSGEVVFVASPIEREQMREERADQQLGFTSQETIAEHGREKGADLMLIGSVDSVKDEVKGASVIFYQVNLELISLEDNTKKWIGQKQIKKSVKQPKFSF